MSGADRVALVTVVDVTEPADRTQVIGAGNRFGASPTIFTYRSQTVWFHIDRVVKGDPLDCLADVINSSGAETITVAAVGSSHSRRIML